MLREAIAMSRDPISVLLSPWSPPACWKTAPDQKYNDAAVYGAMFGRKPPENKPGRCHGAVSSRSTMVHGQDSW